MAQEAFYVEGDQNQDEDGKIPALANATITSADEKAHKMVANGIKMDSIPDKNMPIPARDSIIDQIMEEDEEFQAFKKEFHRNHHGISPPPSTRQSMTDARTDEDDKKPAAQTPQSGATLVVNTLNAQEPTPFVRRSSIRLYVTDVNVVESTAPGGNPLENALKVVDRLSSLGPATSPLILRDALAAAVSRCDDATGAPPEDIPLVGNTPLDDTLKVLASLSEMYGEMEREEKIEQVPIIRAALAEALVRCEEKFLKADRRNWKKIIFYFIIVVVGVILSINGFTNVDSGSNDESNDELRAAVWIWFDNGSVGEWPNSEVTTFYRLFEDEESFNEDLTGWKTARVTSMSFMFAGAASFNGDVSSFDTSQVLSMSAMFMDANSFNSDVSAFDTSRVVSMRNMFNGASSFNSSVSSFDTGRVTTMLYMFEGATSFNGDMSSFDTSQVTDMHGMFGHATSFNQCLEWDLSNVKNTSGMFDGSPGRISLKC